MGSKTAKNSGVTWNPRNLGLVAESLNDFISVQDTSGRRVYGSPSLRNVIGADAVLGADALLGIHPEDRERIAEIFRDTVRTGIGHRANYRFVLKDGAILHIESQDSVIRDAAGNVAYVVVVSRDITDRIKAENQLHEAKQRLDIALGSGSVAIFDWTIPGDEVYISEQWAQLLGGVDGPVRTSSREFVQRIHPGDSAGFKQHSSGALKAEPREPGSPYHAEFRYPTSSGEYKWIEVRSRVIERGADGRAIRVLGTLTDISRQKNAQSKIIRLSNLYAAVSQTSQAIVRITDRETLFKEICRIAIEHGQLHAAWIGLIDKKSLQVVPAAAAGAVEEYVKTLYVSADPAIAEGRGPVGTCINEDRPYICNDFYADERLELWWAKAQSVGYQSMAVFPIKSGGVIVGVLAFYADEKHFFNAEQVSVLEEMAGNVSFALDTYASEASRKTAEVALQESENRYRKLVESSPEAIFVRQAGKFRLVNRACVHLLRAPSAAALIGKPVLDVIHTDYHAIVIERMRRIFSEQVGVPFLEEKWIRLDGSVFDAEIAANPFLIDGEHATQVVIRDISERKQMERLLQGLVEGTSFAESEKFFPAMVQHLAYALDVPYAVIAECRGENFETACVLAFWNGGGWLPGYEYDIENTPCQTLLNDGESCSFNSNVQQHFPGNTLLVEAEAESYLGVTLKDSAGHTIGHLFVMDKKPLRDDARALSILNIFAARAASEVERKRTDENIRHLAHHDLLTGLPNRVLMQDRIEQAIAQAHRNSTRVGLLFLDLDRFKNINDTLGHAAGDRGLQEMARRPRGALRESDTIARVGGDEFMAVIHDFSDTRLLSEVARKILDTVAAPLVIDSQECPLTASIGIATYPDDGADVQTLLKNADIAMYRAKGAGKNNFQFYSARMNIHTIERLGLESRLRRAIDSAEFVVHYQPKVAIGTHRIAGAEALVRWQHPERGLLAPGEFISLAEETGLIGPLGLWVLRTACRQAQIWHAEGLEIGRVAVNLSARQFTQESLSRDIAGVLRETGLDPRRLELELTESAVMSNPDQAVKQMNELKAIGIHLTIDDFGTGYASLTYLKRFPIDSLKIDKSFINGIPDDACDTAITRAVIAMAHGMQLTVVAEGVETAAQVAFLRVHGCDEIQGYVFSRPIPAAAFLTLVRGPQLHLPA